MTGKGRVAVVENDPFQGWLHARALEDAGYTAFVFDTFTDLPGLAREIQACAPQVVLLDEMLAEWEILGHQIIDALGKFKNTGILFAVLSIVADKEPTIESYRQRGVDSSCMVRKPCGPAELVGLVSRTLSRGHTVPPEAREEGHY